MVELVIPGKPIATARPRFAARTNKKTNKTHTHVYSSQETEAGLTYLSIQRQFTRPPLTGAMHVDFEFYFRPPKSAGVKKTQDMLDGRIFHTSKPDFDNLQKFYCDVMKELVWIDDAYISSSTAKKAYSMDQRTVIRIYELSAEKVKASWNVRPEDF